MIEEGLPTLLQSLLVQEHFENDEVMENPHGSYLWKVVAVLERAHIIPKLPNVVLDLCMYRDVPDGTRKRTRLRGKAVKHIEPQLCDGSCGGVDPLTGSHTHQIGMGSGGPPSKKTQVMPQGLIADILQGMERSATTRSKPNSTSKVRTESGAMFLDVHSAKRECKGGEWVVKAVAIDTGSGVGIYSSQQHIFVLFTSETHFRVRDCNGNVTEPDGSGFVYLRIPSLRDSILKFPPSTTAKGGDGDTTLISSGVLSEMFDLNVVTNHVRPYMFRSSDGTLPILDTAFEIQEEVIPLVYDSDTKLYYWYVEIFHPGCQNPDCTRCSDVATYELESGRYTHVNYISEGQVKTGLRKGTRVHVFFWPENAPDTSGSDGEWFPGSIPRRAKKTDLPPGHLLRNKWMVQFDDGETLSLDLSADMYDPLSKDEGSWRFASDLHEEEPEEPTDHPQTDSAVPGAGWTNGATCPPGCSSHQFTLGGGQELAKLAENAKRRQEQKEDGIDPRPSHVPGARPRSQRYSSDEELAHNRWHTSSRTYRATARCVEGMPMVSHEKLQCADENCANCPRASGRLRPLHTRSKKVRDTSKPLEILAKVALDIKTMSTASLQGNKNAFVFVCKESDWVYPVFKKFKSDALAALEDMIQVATLYGWRGLKPSLT